MLMRSFCVFATATIVTVISGTAAVAANNSWLGSGSVELQSVGPMTFAESNVLLLGDPKAATVYAIDTEDVAGQPADAGDPAQLEIKNLQGALAKALGGDPSSIQLGDLAVNPETGTPFLSAIVDGQPRLVRIAPDGTLQPINLDQVAYAKKTLPNPPADEVTGEGRRRRNPRDESITDITYLDGRVIVSGLSSGPSPSTVLEFPFPFAENTIVTNVEIYHAAHGRVESDPAIRTFVPFNIDGQPSLLAGFTCTPLVRFPVDQLRGSEKVRGTTVAELGNRNRPLDMFVYEKDGESYLLLSNSARGVMKVSTAEIESNSGLTEQVERGGTAGQPYETIDSLEGVVEMDKLDNQHAVVIQGQPDQQQSLNVVPLP